VADDLTVIVVAVVGGDAFRACAEAVRSQASRLLLVSHDGEITDGDGKAVGAAEQCNIPLKRMSGAQLAATPLVALIEDMVVPEPGWAEAIESALSDPSVLGCGGPVSLAGEVPASSKALALSEYGAFNKGRPAGEATALPGCNFAFRRDALLEAMTEGEGLVDQLVFERLLSRGKLIWGPKMAVSFCHANDEGARLATRFQHGRIYASASSGRGLVRRGAAAGKALLLPPVLTMRSLRNKPPGDNFSAAAFGWLMLQSTAWAAGEFVGAIFGPSSKGLSQWQ